MTLKLPNTFMGRPVKGAMERLLRKEEQKKAEETAHTISLENITGALAKAFSQVKPETILHAREIMNERRANPELRKQWFWTADFPMYRIENGEAVLYLAPRELNLIFKNVDEAVKQIQKTGNYVPEKKDIDAVVKSANSGETLRVKLSDLNLKEQSDEWCYFEIDTTNYAKLNDARKALAERVYGSGKDFEENMKMIKDSCRDATRICVLNPGYVKKHTKDAICRASWLLNFSLSSNFSAGYRAIDSDDGCLRGVRKVAEGDSRKKIGGYKQ